MDSDKPVEVIESTMHYVINNCKNKPHEAIAHFISGDFNDNMQMRAVVALTFKKTFNRP